MRDDSRFFASCRRCGQVELEPDQMWLVVTDPADRAHFDFHCPGCGRQVVHPADAKTVTVLARLVPVEFLEIPAEALEAHTGPVLTLDDLLDLALALDGVDGLVG